MNKIILIAVVFLGSFGFTIAQETEVDLREKLMVGGKIGINLSNVYDAQGEQFNADAKVGGAFGGFLSIPIGKFIGVQPEVLFSQKGFQATGRIIGNSYSFTRTTNYLDIPLLLAIKPTTFLTILAGPQYSYLFKQKDQFGTATTSTEQITEFNNDNLRKNTLCLTAGADINVQRFIISARAGWDVQNNNGNGSSTTPRYKNMWYQLMVGFRI